MAEKFLGQITMFGFNFPPQGWALCDGQIVPINQNQSLYSLLGTMYGGDGQSTFGLPDLRGRVALGFGSGYTEGSKSGEENHTLSTAEMPGHTHTLTGTATTANSDQGNGNVFAQTGVDVYQTALSNPAGMGPDSIANAGGGQAHNNMQPFLTISFCIALQGLFPPRN